MHPPRPLLPSSAPIVPICLLCTIVGGCPYLWGPPELGDRADTGSIGADADADTDADADADTDADADADTDTDTDADADTDPGPPEVLSFEAEVTLDGPLLSFTLAGGTDLDRGSISLVTDGGAAVQYDLDGGITTWDGAAGFGTLLIQQDATCGGYEHDYSLWVVDGAGAFGDAAEAEVTLAGDTPAEPEPTPVGPVAVPIALCGTLADKNDASTWLLEVGAEAGAVWLIHDAGTDLDVALLDHATGAALASATSAANPDRLGYALVPGTVYRLVVQKHDGSGTNDPYPFTVVITR